MFLWRKDEAILMSTHNICFLRRKDEAILMKTHNICFYGERMR